MIYILSYKSKSPKGILTIDTTSRSQTWSAELSPFFLGPCKIDEGMWSENVENAWQFSKVYKEHINNETGLPNEEWFKWSRKGFNQTFAHRYPKGKNAIPEYSYWQGEKLNYIEARKKIYIPLYSKAVIGTEAYLFLKMLYKKEKYNIALRDFDGYRYDSEGMRLENVVEREDKKMGHAFVLAMMLERMIK